MSFSGLLGSLYGDLPAPKTSVLTDSQNNNSAAPNLLLHVSAVERPTEEQVKPASEDKPLGWTNDRARLLLLQPTSRKREANRKLNSAPLPPAKRLKETSEAQGDISF